MPPAPGLVRRWQGMIESFIQDTFSRLTSESVRRAVVSDIRRADVRAFAECYRPPFTLMRQSIGDVGYFYYHASKSRGCLVSFAGVLVKVVLDDGAVWAYLVYKTYFRRSADIYLAYEGCIPQVLHPRIGLTPTPSSRFWPFIPVGGTPRNADRGPQNGKSTPCNADRHADRHGQVRMAGKQRLIHYRGWGRVTGSGYDFPRLHLIPA